LFVTDPHSPSRSAPGRPKDLEKRAAILDAAKTLFLAKGFDGTSMDAIAASAGVSKLTVYSHFGDKDRLFKAAVVSRCDEQMPAAMFAVAVGTPARQALLTIARGFHGLIHSDEAIALHRMMIANAGQSPHLAELFYEAGPKRTLDGFERYLQAAVQAGQLDIHDIPRAAEHFFVLCKGLAHMRRLVGCGGACKRQDRDAHLDSVVDLFLRAYAPADPPSRRGGRSSK
jgi:TetR/AcrR family transcriptional repressor of mexJK operon